MVADQPVPLQEPLRVQRPAPSDRPFLPGRLKTDENCRTPMSGDRIVGSLLRGVIKFVHNLHVGVVALTL